MIKRIALTVAVIGSLTAFVAPASANAAPANAPVASVKTDDPPPAPAPNAGDCDQVRVAIGQMAKQLHWTAEETFKVMGIQPFLQPIDKPYVHPVLWTPIAELTCVDVDSHPADIG